MIKSGIRWTFKNFLLQKGRPCIWVEVNGEKGKVVGKEVVDIREYCQVRIDGLCNIFHFFLLTLIFKTKKKK